MYIFMDIYHYKQWEREFHDLGYEERFFDSNGTRLCYYSYIDGSRETLLLMHGFSANKHWWDFCLPRLTRKFNVIALDLCGMGKSDHLKHYEPHVVIQHIHQLLQSINIEKFHFVAHSFGAYLASFMLTVYPEHFLSFTCMDLDLKAYNPNIDRPSTNTKPIPRRWYASKDIALSRFRLIPGGHVADDPRWLHYIASKSVCKIGEQWTWCFDPNIFLYHKIPCLDLFSENVKRFNIPCCLIVGEKTALFRIEDAIQNWNSIVPIKIGSHSIIGNAYHHLMLDQPLECVETICRFILQLDP